MPKKIVYWTGFKNFLGLMFKKPKRNTIYILDLKRDKKVDVHTFFCLEPLDIILLDSQLNIVGKYLKTPPFRIIFPKKKFRFILEGTKLSDDDIKYAIDYLKNKIKL